MGSGVSGIVGRASELERLDAELESLAAGRATCLAIEGEPGIGKTALLAELQRRAEERGHTTLTGSAAEFERDLPFGAWADALDAYVASQEPGPRDGFDEELIGDLAGVLPSLGRPRGNGDSAQADARFRAHRAMRKLLELLAARKPLVLILDDLHWADSASVELIGSLLRRGPDAPVLLAIAFRAGAEPAELRSALADPSVARVALAPLSEQECSQLVGDTLDSERVAAIFDESGGNPFYTWQLARAAELPTPHPSGRGTAGNGGVPRAVSAALTAELQRLSPGSQVLLNSASIAGDPFEPELAYEIGELEPAAGIAALDELLDASLIRSTDVPRRFAFRHPLVRRAVYESTKGGWRLGAHARAATALARRGASPIARAHHVEQSAAQADREAIDLLIAAGHDSASRSPAGAARWYAAALRLLPETDTATRTQTLVDLAAARRATGNLGASRTALLEALEIAPPADAALRLRLTTSCALAESFLGLHDEARERLASALDAIEDEDSRDAAVTLLALARGAFFVADVDRLEELSTRALAVATKLGDRELMAAAVAMRSHGHMIGDNIAAAQADQTEAMALLNGLSDTELARSLDAVHELCRTSLQIERYADAVYHARRGLAVSRATGRGEYLALILNAQAWGLTMLGNLDEAEELQVAAVEAARLTGNNFTVCTLLGLTAQIGLLRGDTDAALRAAEESVTLVGASARGHITTLARARLAFVIRQTGGTRERAAEHVADAGGWALTRLPAPWRVAYHEAFARLELEDGDTESATESVERAESAAAEVGLGVAAAIGERARARMLLARGDAAGAAELALASAAGAASAGARIEAAQSRLVAGRALAAAGERSEAVSLLRAAESEFDDCGALHGRGETRRELRKLGARSEPRGPGTAADSGLGALSVREREVAELVSRRKTNREIAQELYLSEKTIESHLRNIFVKLGASSRVEVARAVERGADS